MVDYMKLDLANEIMSAMIAKQSKLGLGDDNKALKILFEEKKELRKSNPEIIDKIINVYGPMLKKGVMSHE